MLVFMLLPSVFVTPLAGVQTEEIEIMTSADAAMFPVYASCALFSLFLLFKVRFTERLSQLNVIY